LAHLGLLQGEDLKRGSPTPPKKCFEKAFFGLPMPGSANTF
jgi:hypothetical protein